MCHGMGCRYEYGPYRDCGKPKGEPCPPASWNDEDQEEKENSHDEEDH